MNIMAGGAFPSEGAVLLNDDDLHPNFQALKQDIAFVPQQDVLHEQLTLRQALDYTAQLRLPPDTTVEQRYAAVDDAARSVDLLDRLTNASAHSVEGKRSAPAWPAKFSTVPVCCCSTRLPAGWMKAPTGKSCACCDAWPMTE